MPYVSSTRWAGNKPESRSIGFNGWVALHRISLACIALPFLFLLISVFAPAGEYWQQVKDYLLKTYFIDTLLLLVFSGLFSVLLGVSLAWCTSVYDFRGRRAMEILLFLPLAIPPYIAAYTFDGMLGYTGVIQSFLRNSLNLSAGAASFSIPAMPFAVFVFTITLFPYVFLFVRTFLYNQSGSLLENAVLLGGSKRRAFFRIILPLLIPSMLAGGTLVCLEVLNDYGVTSYLGLNTFTTAIFAAWFGMGDVDTAIKLAVILLAIVIVFLLIARGMQHRRKYRIVSSKERKLAPGKLSGWRGAIVVAYCLLAVLVAFVVPVTQMLAWAIISRDRAVFMQILGYVGNTLYVGGMATVLIMFFAVGAANANRLFARKYTALSSQATTMGYAIPSAVLSMGVITAFALLDRSIQGMLPALAGLPVSMTVAMLVYAYSVRFYSIGYQAVDTGFSKIGPIYTEASRTLGLSVTRTFFRVDLHMIRQAIVCGAGLVFVDIIKELPLTLTLRPFNFDTLGTKVYEYANNEAIHETAFPSLCIVAVSALVIILMQLWAREEKA
ncbi:iron ABC transporter permease [Oxalobacter sp. OttesenSCG-928-P03]|nr:iron ABC transporter permease [Oxalobacter sp. OttesenSCG-928-P03]